MTLQKIEEFNENGCASRCIIALANLYNNPITREEFVSRFENDFPFWKTNCGLLATSEIIEIGKTLGLCDRAATFCCQDKARAVLESKKFIGMFVITDRDFDNPENPIFHCSVVRDYTKGAWSLWSPLRNGEDCTMAIPSEALDKRMAHFLVMF